MLPNLLRVLLPGFCLLVPGMVAPRHAQAAAPVTIPQGPLPVGELPPVEFSFLTIDGTISPTDGGIVLSARTRARLRNPDKKQSFERQVTYPAPPVADVKGGNLTTGDPANPSPPVWVLAVPPDGGAIIEATQNVAANGPLVDLQLDWAAIAPWGSPLGAVRLTLHFPDNLDSEQLLAVSPDPTERDVVNLTWSYEKFRPSGKVQVFFIAPSYWQALRTARRATANPQASAASYRALAAALRPLIAAEGMPAGRARALRDELLAALRQAVAVAPKEAWTHKELATELYQRAQGDPGVLAEAANELKAAYDLAPGDAELKGRLLAVIDELVAACRQAGDPAGLLHALDLAQAVDAGRGAERMAAYADRAVALLGEGRTSEAEAIIVAGFGQAALAQYTPYRPQFASVTGEVETHAGQRILRFSLAPAPGMNDAAAQSLASLAEAMGRVAGCQAKHTTGDSESQIEITIPFTHKEQLRTVGQALAAALPADADPALALVTAASGPASADFQAARQRWADRLAYSEDADLTPAQRTLGRRLEELKRAQAEAEAKTDDAAEAARRRWLLALLGKYEADWQALTMRCQVTYRLLPADDVAAPYWVLAWGEKRPLTWSATIPRPERLWPYVFGLGVLVLLLVGAWLVVHWRRNQARYRL